MTNAVIETILSRTAEVRPTALIALPAPLPENAGPKSTAPGDPHGAVPEPLTRSVGRVGQSLAEHGLPHPAAVTAISISTAPWRSCAICETALQQPERTFAVRKTSTQVGHDLPVPTFICRAHQ